MPSIVLLSTLFAIALVAFAAQDGPEMPMGPAPELKFYDKYVGTWDAEVEMMGQVSKGVETCRMGVGGVWLVTDFEGSFMGAPFCGHGVNGFDAASGSYNGVWVDSTGGAIASIHDGKIGKNGRELVSVADGVGMDGKPSRSRHVTTFDGTDRRTFVVYAAGEDGGEVPMMTIRYQRRK